MSARNRRGRTGLPADLADVADARAAANRAGASEVTAVTASPPLASSGGATPDISIASAVPIADGGTGQVTALAAINALLPSQGGNAGKVLETDGTNPSWVTPSTSSPPVSSPRQAGPSQTMVSAYAGLFPNGGGTGFITTGTTATLLLSATAVNSDGAPHDVVLSFEIVGATPTGASDGNGTQSTVPANGTASMMAVVHITGLNPGANAFFFEGRSIEASAPVVFQNYQMTYIGP